MKTKYKYFYLIVLMIVCGNVYSQDYAKAAPYSGIRWDESISGNPQVLIKDQWYILLGINDLKTEEIMMFCQKTYKSKAIKRFNEDIVEILSKMGYPPSDKVKLFLSRIDTKEKIILSDVEMTLDNRTALKIAWEKKNEPIPPERLTAVKIQEDLQLFQNSLEAQFAYLKANKVDYKSAISAIKKKGTNGLSTDDFALELQKLIGFFIDGHAGVSPRNFLKGFLPFGVVNIGSRVVAYKTDRSGFLDDGYPYLTKIDNIDIQNWINFGDDYRASGSPQYKMRQGLRMLRNIQHIRGDMGLPLKDSIDVELLSKELTKIKLIRLPVIQEKVKSAKLFFNNSHITNGNIGYLRIESFSSKGNAVKDIEEWLPKFKNTNGLIIDVRGNGGGSRAGLLALYPYLMESKDIPGVANICAYRKFSKFEEDHLAARFAYRENDPHWNEKERKAINKFMKTFKPQWEAEEGEFSDWHFVLLSKRDENKKNYYNKPVVVLLNGGCFSATDIFLGALKGWRPNIKLVGAPSGGGSARSQRFSMKNSRIKVKCASMISFQRTGALYDTNGIQPDYLVYPDPEYFLKNGKDNVLEKALEILEIR